MKGAKHINTRIKRVKPYTKKLLGLSPVIIAIITIIAFSVVSWSINSGADDFQEEDFDSTDTINDLYNPDEPAGISSTDALQSDSITTNTFADSLSFRQATNANAGENDVSVHPKTSSQSMFDTSDLPEFDADAFILIDRHTGQTICSKNADMKLYPASTTKIMTAILALEMGDMNELMTASVRAVRDIGPDGSNIGIIAGEKMRLENLLDALLVRSANETANIIAENICDTREEFIELMNSKAKELGAYNTNFTNASGIHETTHYSTAYDLAMISNYAMNNEHFRTIVAQRSINLSPTNKHTSWDRLNSTNSLLTDDTIKDFSVNGVKTGYHSAAGYCIVASGVDSNGLELLCVVLGVRGDIAGTSAKRFKIAADLLSYGFENYQMHTFIRDNELIGTISVLGGEDLDTVDVVSDGTVRLFMPMEQQKWDISRIEYVKSELVAPVVSGDTVGYVEYRNAGSFAGRVNLLATSDIPALKGGAREVPNRGDTGSAWSELSLAGGAKTYNIWAGAAAPQFEGDIAESDADADTDADAGTGAGTGIGTDGLGGNRGSGKNSGDAGDAGITGIAGNAAPSSGQAGNVNSNRQSSGGNAGSAGGSAGSASGNAGSAGGSAGSASGNAGSADSANSASAEIGPIKSFLEKIDIFENIKIVLFIVLFFAALISILRTINALLRSKRRRARTNLYHGRLDYPPMRGRHRRARQRYAPERIKYDAPRMRAYRRRPEERARDKRYSYSN